MSSQRKRDGVIARSLIELIHLYAPPLAHCLPFVWEIADDSGTVHVEIKAFKCSAYVCVLNTIEDLHSHIETNEANQAGCMLFSRYINKALLPVLLFA